MSDAKKKFYENIDQILSILVTLLKYETEEEVKLEIEKKIEELKELKAKSC